MNKKWIYGILSVLFLAIAVIGTVAYFTKSFTSDKNTAMAAKFDVDAVNSKGKTIGDAQFNLGDKLYPGMETLEAYSFQIKKNNTEVPVKYTVNVTHGGELFPADGSSPVKLVLQRNIDGAWVDTEFSTAFKPESDTEKFKILVSWPHGENDLAFQGKKGNIKLQVIAEQIDSDEEVESPPYFTGEVKFKATPNGSTRTTANKEITFYENKDGFKVIEVKMGDGNGDFESKVGNFTVTGEMVNGKLYYRVITDQEYYASKSQIWRASADKIDTSVQGVVKFNGTLAPYLSIESNALYKWFTK